MKKSLSRNLIGTLSSVSGAAIYQSLWQPIDDLNHYMIQVVWSGTPVADVSLVISADPIEFGYVPLATLAPTNYDFKSGTTIATSGVVLSPSGSYMITYEVTTSDENWVSVYWSNASSSGTITSINFSGKGSQV